MIKGINGKPYIPLDDYLDISGFKELHYEICKGFALAREYAKEGTWMTPGMDFNEASYKLDHKPIFEILNLYNSLPDDHPAKIYGKDLYPTDFNDYKQRNLFTRYIKAALGANDPYIYYFLWEEGNWNSRNSEKSKTEESKFFPGVVKWVENLVDQNIISQIGRVIFFLCDHNGRAFEHRDIHKGSSVDSQGYYPHKNEFIHIRSKTKRGFYIWDHESEQKFYINSNSAFWNDQDWHGGESSKEQEYGLRIDCVFTDEFRKKLGIDHLGNY